MRRRTIATAIMAAFMLVLCAATPLNAGRLATYSGTTTERASITGGSTEDTWYDTGTGLLYYWTGAAWTLFNAALASSPDTLTTSGDTGTAVASAGYDEVLLTAICKGTSVDCSFRLQGYKDGTGWASIASGDTTGVDTDDGVAHVVYVYPSLFDSLRAQAEHVSASDSVITKIVLRKNWDGLP